MKTTKNMTQQFSCRRSASVLKSALLFFVFTALMGNLGWGQITIGSNSGSLIDLPVNPYWGYSYSQQIVLKSEINTAGQITKIKFYMVGGISLSYSNNWTIYLGHTTKASFASNTDWVPLASMTQVYSGTINATPAAGWYEISLTGTFNYNNTDNLVIAVDENATNYNGSTPYASYWTASGTRSIYYRSDTQNPDPASPPTASGTSTFVNYMQLVFVSSCNTPTALTSSSITSTSATISWTAATPAPGSGYEYYYSTSSTAPTAGTTASGSTAAGVVTANLSGLSANTTYYFWVRSNCDGTNKSGWAGSASFTTLCAATITGTTPDSRCGTGTVSLGATGSAGTTINWYSAASGGSSLGTGTSYTTPSISTTTTYYVDATSGGCTSTPRTAVVATVSSAIPSITANPSNATVTAGSNTSFSVTASNSPASYTWQVSTDGGTTWSTVSNGGVYSNATTATLNITGATAGMNGYKYKASATNGCGTSAYSSVATLTVNTVTYSTITLVGSSTALVERTNILTINKPSGVIAGDLLIASISVLNSIGCDVEDATCSGWTKIPGTSDIGGGTAKHATMLYKIATGSEPASYTFTSPYAGCTYAMGTDYFCNIGGIASFRGVDQSSPFDAIGTMQTQYSYATQASSTILGPSITTNTNNCAVVLFVMEACYENGYYTSFQDASWQTATSPGALNEIYDDEDYYCAVGAAWAPMAIHGVTGDGTASMQFGGGTKATWASILIALKPKTTLPVSLLNFTGECKEGSKTLSWATASEINNNYFIVERSSDKNNWTVVGKVAGAGNSNTIQHYSLTDLASEGETVYYRLTQADFDGASETFDAIAVSCENNNPVINCYPNPFNDQLVISLQNMEASEGEINLIDVTGRTVMHKVLTASELMQNSIELSIPDIAQGVYSLEFRTGDMVKVMRVVKNK